MELLNHATKILINYDEIIKPSGLFIIRTIRDNYFNQFSKYLNLAEIKELSEEDLEIFYVSRNTINPFEWLQISEFDIEKNYEYFYNKYKNMYISTKPFQIMKAIQTYISSYFITNVYFYSKQYDKRIDFEVASIKNGNKNERKIIYITGNLNNVIDDINPNVVFYPYLDEIYESTIKKYREIVFAIPRYGYNFKNDSNQLTDEDINIGFYPVIQLAKPKYFG